MVDRDGLENRWAARSRGFESLSLRQNMNFPVVFTASAIKGAGRGKEMGIPTINVDLSAVPEELEDGIYACYVELDGVRYHGAMHYGPRPVFDDSRACEVHLLDTTVEVVPSQVSLEVVEYLREIRDFPTTEALVTQIEQDIQQCRTILDYVQ